jgi:hypothetical protein
VSSLFLLACACVREKGNRERKEKEKRRKGKKGKNMENFLNLKIFKK